MANTNLDTYLHDWQDRETLVESMIPTIGRLYRKYNVVPSIYGRAMVNQSVIRILKDHRFVRQIEGEELHPRDSQLLLETLLKLEPGPCHVDVGKLAVEFRKQKTDDMEAFLRAEMGEVLGKHKDADLGGDPQDVVLYGFGRIGRLVARILLEKSGGGSLLRLRAVVVRGGQRGDLEKRASLLRRDSVHGRFDGTITVDNDNNALIVNGNYIQFIYANSPSEIDYTKYDINNAIIVDNTGIWRDEAGLSQHLAWNGASRALLTAPGKGDIKNIVFGVNHTDIKKEDRIVSAASCTTNAIVPVLKALNDKYGIHKGHVETVHAYTNDQNLIDNFHKGDRRGRAAAMNMVLTETGAASAVAKALPELKGKLTGNAIRVPTPNVSMAILNLTLDKEAKVEEMNDYLSWAALFSPMQKQIDFVDSAEVVSSDFVGNRHAGIVDGKATIVDGNHAVIYVWYDNEFGYSCQVVRILQHMANVQTPYFPADRG